MAALSAERGNETSTARRPRPSRTSGFVGLRKLYGDVAAVDGVDLDIGRGEFFTMLGPSGSGKTTTLRLIAGFERPDEGTISLRGRRRERRPALRARREHGLPGLRALPAHDRRRERRSTGSRSGASPAPSAARASTRHSRRSSSTGYGARRPAQLSGGQRQRVALARALVNHPQVLLLDEPLGALDLKLRQEMQIELKRIQQEVGITFIYVTHDQDEALTMSDRLAVFNQGKIEQVGPPAEVYEHPQTEFVAGFVGVSNLLERGRTTIQRPAGEDPDPRRRGAGGGRRAGRRGTIREVVYAGMVTRYIVELDDGGELTVVVQNLETTSAQALEARGRNVAARVAARAHTHPRDQGEKEHR